MPEKNHTKMLAVLFCTAFVAALNANIINVGLADIMAEFAIDANTANWLVTGYMIVTAIVVTAVAFLLKRVGLRALFLAAGSIFTVGCALALLAPTFPLLVCCRLLQAVGAGIFIPTMMNTVLAVAPKKKIGTYLAIGSCCITFGPALGPLVSGLMVTFFGWRTMFAFPMTAMAIALAVGVFLVKNIGETEKVHLDIASLILSAIGLTAVVFGLSKVLDDIVIALVSLAIGLAILAGFVIRQNRIAYPFLNLTPLKNPRFTAACVLVIVCMMTGFSMNVLLPLYFMNAIGATALAAGALIIIPILVQAATSVIGGKTMDARGEWPLLPVAFLLIAVGQVCVCLIAGQLNIIAVVAAAALVYGGIGLAFSPSQAAGLKKLPHEMNPYGVSIMSTFIQVAAAIGPSLFVGILSSTVSGQMVEGAAFADAQATGFSSAIAIAAIIAAVGLVVSFVYARMMAKEGARAKVAAPQATSGSVFLSLEHVMKKKSFTVSRGDSVHTAVERMLENHTSGLPIIDEGGVVIGFISDGDVMKALSDQDSPLLDLTYALATYAGGEALEEQIDAVMRLNVMDLATTQVISIDADASIKRVCTVLSERRIKKVPVLRDGKLVGTVSRSDVTRSLLAAFAAKR